MTSRVVDWLFTRRDGSVEDPRVPLSDARLLDLFGVAPTDAGVHVDERSALTFSAVYRSIALLSGLVATLPLHVYEKTGPGRRDRVDAPLLEDAPHPDLTPFELFEHIGRSEASNGNGYLLKVRDRALRVRELWPFQPDRMRVETSARWRTAENPRGKRFFYDDDGRTREYTPFEVLHIPGLGYDGIVGLSPIGLARQSIGLPLAAERFGARMFGRGGLIPGVLQTDQKLDKEQAERLQDRWQSKTAGPENQWRVPVLSHGAKFQSIALPPADVQFLETRRFGVTDVARWYGLPPHLVGDVERSTSWGTGIEQQNLQMLVFTFDPWLVRIEQRLSLELLPRGRYARFQRAALLRADISARYLAYQRAVNNGWMSPDEIRALEELDPIPGGAGRTFYRPGNLEPINAAGGGGQEDDDATD